MTLNEWMAKTETRAAELARFVGCDVSYVSHLKRGKAHPGLAVMDLIAIFTDGAVGRNDWPSPLPTPQPNPPGRPALPARG